MGYFLLTSFSFSSAWIFNCKYSVASAAIIGTTYQCYPRLSNPGDKSNLESVVGTHVSGKSLLDVDSLYIENQDVGYVPKDIELFFPNLKGLQFHIGHLLSISATDLKPFPNLLSLALARNMFTSLPGDLFQYTPKLAYLDFDNNQIQHEGVNLLKHLKDLKYGRFRNNPCINFYASTPTEVETLKLKLVACPLIDPVPDPTTTIAPNTDETDTCPFECSERIETLECKVHEIEKKLRQVANILRNI